MVGKECLSYHCGRTQYSSVGFGHWFCKIVSIRICHHRSFWHQATLLHRELRCLNFTMRIHDMNRREFVLAAGVVASQTGRVRAARRGMPAVPVEGRYKDQSSLIIESETLRAEFIAHGGRMVSLRDKRSNYELLFQQGESRYVRATYGGAMENNQAAGYDDMFPTIGECHYEDFPWKGVELPDHGEVWSLDWEMKAEKDSIILGVHGVRLPYRLSRRVTFSAPNELRMDYTLENFSPFEMSYLWSAHPLLRVEAGTRIELPEECRTARSVSSVSGRLGNYGNEITWPLWTDSKGKKHDLSVLRGTTAHDSEKYFFNNKMVNGWCRLKHPSNGLTLSISFPPEKLPYLAVVVGEGVVGDGRFFALLEPCSAPFDRLDVSKSYTRNSKVAPKSSTNWYVSFSVTA
ncbi:MAG: hypothetical protein EXQ58_08095 [Acidobacteria bacterium]|nr:hypothetical protein [Acidobacteriota bacterium]